MRAIKKRTSLEHLEGFDWLLELWIEYDVRMSSQSLFVEVFITDTNSRCVSGVDRNCSPKQIGMTVRFYYNMHVVVTRCMAARDVILAKNSSKNCRENVGRR